MDEPVKGFDPIRRAHLHEGRFGLAQQSLGQLVEVSANAEGAASFDPRLGPVLAVLDVVVVDAGSTCRRCEFPECAMFGWG